MLAARNTSSSQMYSYCLGAEKTTAGPTLVGGGKGRKRRQNWNNERSEFIVVFIFLLQIRSRAFIFMTVPKNYSLIVSSLNKVSLVSVSSCINTGSIRDDAYWISGKNSLELTELSSTNKVSLV